jgi:hypothetical protein
MVSLQIPLLGTTPNVVTEGCVGSVEMPRKATRGIEDDNLRTACEFFSILITIVNQIEFHFERLQFVINSALFLA